MSITGDVRLALGIEKRLKAAEKLATKLSKDRRMLVDGIVSEVVNSLGANRANLEQQERISHVVGKLEYYLDLLIMYAAEGKEKK